MLCSIFCIVNIFSMYGSSRNVCFHLVSEISTKTDSIMNLQEDKVKVELWRTVHILTHPQTLLFIHAIINLCYPVIKNLVYTCLWSLGAMKNTFLDMNSRGFFLALILCGCWLSAQRPQMQVSWWNDQVFISTRSKWWPFSVHKLPGHVKTHLS